MTDPADPAPEVPLVPADPAGDRPPPRSPRRPPPRASVGTVAAPDPSAVGVLAKGGTSGAGAGTLFLMWANGLPADDPRKPYLLLIAPTLTIAAAAAGGAMLQAARWAFRQVLLAVFIYRMRRTLRKAIQSAETPDDRKRELTQELQELSRVEIEDQKATVHALTSRQGAGPPGKPL